MTDEQRTLALLAEANPIPTDDVGKQSTPSAVEALAAAQGQTQRTNDGANSDGRNEQWRRLAFAAGLVILMAAAVLLFSRAGESVQQVDTDRTTTTQPDVTTSEPEESRRPIEGFWKAVSFTLILEPNGYAVVANDLIVDQGGYVIAGNRLTLTTGEGSVNCSSGTTAEIIFELSGLDSEAVDQLNLEYDTDDCGLGRGIGVGSTSLDRTETFAKPESALDVVRPLGEGAAPGRFFTPTFTPGFEITLTSGWAQFGQRDFHMFIRRGTEGLIFHNHDLDSPEEVYRLFDDHSSTQVGEARPTEVAGAPGLTFDYLSPGPNTLFLVPGVQLGSLQPPFDYPTRVWAVDVDGTAVTIAFASQPSTFEEQVAAVETILSSIVWDDLTAADS